MAVTKPISQRIEEFVRTLSQELGAVDPARGTCWLDSIEQESLALSDAVHRALIQERSSHVEHPETWACPECGCEARCRGLRERELITERGPTTISEVECYCPACRRAFFPSDPSVGS